jgi:hypothetical protein
MESKTMDQKFTLIIQPGGMIEFRETGILTRYLVFISASLGRTWRLKLKDDTQNGVLKIRGQIEFNYFFDGFGCKIQSVTDGVVGEEWEIDEILIQLQDVMVD